VAFPLASMRPSARLDGAGTDWRWTAREARGASGDPDGWRPPLMHAAMRRPKPVATGTGLLIALPSTKTAAIDGQRSTKQIGRQRADRSADRVTEAA